MSRKASKGKEINKSITVRFDREAYDLLIAAANNDNRSIANFIETVTLQVLKDAIFTDINETNEIINNHELMAELKSAEEDIKHGRGRFV